MNKEKCEHGFGYRTIGGFPGHEHIHTSGVQTCLKCEKTFDEIVNTLISQAEKEAVEGFVDYMWKDEKKHSKEVYRVAKHYAKLYLSSIGKEQDD